MADPHLHATWRTFTEAAAAAVRVLHARVGMDFWLVTRLVGPDQLVVAADPADLVENGTALSWADSYCSRMVTGEGPRAAPVVAVVPEYAGLRAGQQPKVAAYLGVPLHRRDGSLYGSLCGFSSRAQPPALSRQLPIVELVGGLLATMLTEDDDQVRPSAARSGPPG